MDNFTFKHLFRTMLSAVMLIFLCFNAVASSENMDAVSSDAQTPQDGTIQIRGTVSDRSGILPGVNVTVEGTTIGVSTDEKGEYKIMVPNGNSVLEFRFIGYLPQKIVVSNRNIISIFMDEDNTSMDEVTVVAFGKQKKESVIGAITTINPAQLKRPTSNLTTSLAGNMAGIIAYQRNGEPGADNADFFVRGITTFGNNTRPLILIDGVELTSTDLARMQPDDIASFSVMKDATATALYGARGANGVILVTTKQGTVGPARISIRLENSFSAPTKNIEVADPITYMKMYNEATRTRYQGTGNSLDALYSQDKIDNTMAGADPVYYPNTDWQKELLKNYTTNQRANVSVSGGGGVARYYVASSLNHDSGMFKIDKRNNFNNNISNNSYTLRANVNIDLTKTTELSVRTSGVFDDYSGPVNGGTDMYNRVIHANPVLFPAYYEPDEEHWYTKHIMFGNADGGQYINPYADLIRGYKQQTRAQLQSQVEIKQDLKFITEGLSIRAMVNISRLSQFSVERSYTPFLYKTTLKNTSTGVYHLNSINDNGTEYLGYGENPGDKATHSSLYFEGMTNYSRSFKKHSVSGLLVFTARNSLIANTGELQRSLPSRNVGLSGRATYSYDNKYFGEFNFGYNGSERFSKNHRYGFFPSAGAAWVISNEKFWEKVKPVVSNLKLRYSYGLVGNDQIGDHNDRFFYLSQVEMNEWGKGASFGTDNVYRRPGINVRRYANPDITWEISTKKNYAIEVGLWNKVMFIADYFTEYRDNILLTRANIPASMGLEVHPRANLGAASGYGVDMSLEYQHSFNEDLWASARGNYTFARNKYSKYEEPNYPHPWTYGVGYSIHQERGYIAERLFADDIEAANSPHQEIGDRPYGGGDIKYTDVNNDGVVNDRDRVPIGKTSLPEITYGFGFSMGYKGIDFSAFFQGQANQSFLIDATNTSPFQGETQLLQAYADSHWSEDNQDMYALWPRLSTFVHPNNNTGSTWHMRNGNFLRLKQAEIGYTLPNHWTWMKKSTISNIRLYLSGTNLLLFSKFKLWDVEMGGNGFGYPLQRVFNIGLNVTFN